MALTEVNLTTRERLRPPSDRLRKETPKRITNKDRSKAVELYESGLSLNAVAKELGVSRYVVTSAVERAGIEFRDRYDYIDKKKDKQ